MYTNQNIRNKQSTQIGTQKPNNKKSETSSAENKTNYKKHKTNDKKHRI